MTLPRSHRIRTRGGRILRAPIAADRPHIFSATRHPGFNEGMRWDPPASEAELDEPHRLALERWDEGSAYGFAIVDEGEGAFLGKISLGRTSRDGVWDLGFWTHPDRQRQGIMTDAAAAMVELGFRELGAERIEAAHACWNLASRRVLTRTGLRFVRHIPRGFRKRGRWVPEDLLALDRGRWLIPADSPEESPELVLAEAPEVPESIAGLCRFLVDGLRSCLGEALGSIVLYGAAAFPDAVPSGDVDVHILLHRPPTSSEQVAIRRLHDELASRFPPLGGELDAWYILAEDARRADLPRHLLQPEAVDGSWALHRAHIRAGRRVVLYGPDPAAIMPAPTWPELKASLRTELGYVDRHLLRVPAYCVLNLCRLEYSLTTHEVVVSKAAASVWAWERFPRCREAIRLARKEYAGLGTKEEQERLAALMGRVRSQLVADRST